MAVRNCSAIPAPRVAASESAGVVSACWPVVIPAHSGVRTSSAWEPGMVYTTTKTLICSGWETAVVPVSQPERQSGTKGVPFCPGSGNQDKRGPSAHVAGAPFCPGWCYQPGQKVSFFFMFFFSQFFFYFNYTFAFQLNLCIGIQCV